MKILAEVTYEGDKLGEDNNLVVEKEKVFLLHFGITYQMIDMGAGYMIPANYTVAICQNCETGQIKSFLPDQLRIIGQDITNLKTTK